MKKYISSLLILMVMFTLNIKTVRAESSKEFDDSWSVRGNTSVKANFHADIEDKIKELKTEREMIKTELKNQTEESRQKIQTLREEIKNQIQTTKEEAKQKMEKLKAEAKGEIEQKRITVRENALERFDQVIQKMEDLKNKINAQITKFEAKGVDTTESKASIIVAETKIDEAKAKIVEINELLSTSVAQLTLEQKATLKTLTKDTQALIKEIHTAFTNAVKVLRASVAVKLKTEATVNTTETNQ